ncbi:MAG: hypothetical protein FWH53_05985 [Leptospirales bacterium]|nr:hypothetical protein [Leptospirales bacterium]
MKIVSKIILSMAFALLITLSFTSYVQAEAFKSMSFGGATGLISTPTAHTGWEGNAFGLDLGYHYINGNDKGSRGGENGEYHIPKALLHLGIAGTSLELGFAYDIQPEFGNDDKTNDLLFNVKWVFSKGIAIGGNFQRLDLNADASPKHDKTSSDEQIYLAFTFPGTFIASMPAETTIVIGHTFYGEKGRTAADRQKKNIDLSMGFDLDLLPQYFKGYIHWINDFSNYSYSTEAGGADAWYRGCFNTGLRIAPLKEKKYKLNFDIILTDALDNNRDWAFGVTFGLAL